MYKSWLNSTSDYRLTKYFLLLLLPTNQFSVRKTTMHFSPKSCSRLYFPTEPRFGSFFGAFSNADGHNMTYFNLHLYLNGVTCHRIYKLILPNFPLGNESVATLLALHSYCACVQAVFFYIPYCLKFDSRLDFSVQHILYDAEFYA